MISFVPELVLSSYGIIIMIKKFEIDLHIRPTLYNNLKRKKNCRLTLLSLHDIHYN